MPPDPFFIMTYAHIAFCLLHAGIAGERVYSVADVSQEFLPEAIVSSLAEQEMPKAVAVDLTVLLKFALLKLPRSSLKTQSRKE